jgi:hypothetical protein
MRAIVTRLYPAKSTKSAASATVQRDAVGEEHEELGQRDRPAGRRGRGSVDEHPRARRNYCAGHLLDGVAEPAVAESRLFERHDAPHERRRRHEVARFGARHAHLDPQLVVAFDGRESE